MIEPNKIKTYLKEGTLQPLSEDKREILNKEITLDELRESIKKQKSNKTSGPDGLPSELYKELGEVLEDLLLEICNEVIVEARTPDFWKEAYITLIPKEGADANQVKNYRPISLLKKST
uniref:Reverse transcriptase domain-containing protein n=1 Tax=Micrurus lemniscatus lemniscatus TaxID=129467 RepID=A0A2D4IBW1_MICLE